MTNENPNKEAKAKPTVRLPKTNFGMKANFVDVQNSVLKYWESENIYEKMQTKNKAGKSFILHDGPPYANGNIHLGHA